MAESMKENLRVAMIQTDVVWEQPRENKKQIEILWSSFAKEVAENPLDLILLPEMFATGFTANPLVVEEREGPIFQWMQQWAISQNSVLAGTVATYSREGLPVNRFYWIRPNGSYSFYDKYHLFKGREADFYTPGEWHHTIEEWGWKFMPHICYELRFPLYGRNRLIATEQGVQNFLYDVALFPAAWPQARIQHWDVLLQARAIENMVYTLGVNQVGKDGYGSVQGGKSRIVTPQGHVLAEADEQKAEVMFVSLEYKKMQDYRKAFPVAYDWDMPFKE